MSYLVVARLGNSIVLLFEGCMLKVVMPVVPRESSVITF